MMQIHRENENGKHERTSFLFEKGWRRGRQHVNPHSRLTSHLTHSSAVIILPCFLFVVVAAFMMHHHKS
jgi:hypothetical protein